MRVIGLTGSIGMGKSTTAQMFRDEGLPVLDADAVVHALYRGAAVPPVEVAFPGVTVDGAIDRERLRARVLADPGALKRLEAIVHPLVAEARCAFLAEAAARREPAVVLDIPLLFETGLDREVDHIVVVSASEAVQKARVLARPGMTEGQLSAILAQQVPDAEKRRRADTVIETGAGFDETRAQVQALVARLRSGRLDA
jgi:dephospho-CoA kinase